MPKDQDGNEIPPMELFPSDEMSTGETSSLIKRAQQITGGGVVPKVSLEVDPSLKPTTGARLAFKPTTGSVPALKPTTGTQPALKPSTGNFPALSPQEVQKELRARALQSAAAAKGTTNKPARPVKPPSAADDTFVKRKMRQAENNLPDWNFDADDEPG